MPTPPDRYTLPKLTPAAFRAYHRANPGIYSMLRHLAVAARRNGRKHLGIKAMCEYLRFETPVSARQSPWRIDNSFAADYARLLMRREPQLRGLFEIRGRK
jgi:hypothetical protein